MVDTQHFCLRWNNYQSSITSAFENLRDDEDFVDVTLACDGKSLKAHRVVLSACSPYFRELLKSTPCKHPVIVLQDVAWTDLHALVEFIYHGEVNVHQRSLSSFLKTAEVLRVSGLTQQHGEDKDQLAQVQSLVRAHHQTPPTNHHYHPIFPEKLEDSLFTSPSSPPHGATVNQLLRQAALQQNRSNRRISSVTSNAVDNDNHTKRLRPDYHHHLLSSAPNNNNNLNNITNNNNNNNNELNLSGHQTQAPPPQTQPTDFSPSAMKNSPLNLNVQKDAVEGNGIGGQESENGPCSPSPTSGTTTTGGISDTVKSEPMELLCGSTQENSNDSEHHPTDNGPTSNLPAGPHSGSSGGGDHEDHDSSIGPYLTPAESKLFATAAGSFNFSMAALAADPTGLGGLNQTLGGNADTLAGTSQVWRCEGVVRSRNKDRRRTDVAIDGGHHHHYDDFKATARMASTTMRLTAEEKTTTVSLQREMLCGVAGASPKKVFTCQLCGKMLCSKASLKRHIADKHAERQEEYRCVICERVYCSRNSLMTHIYTYHKSRPGDVDIKFF